MTIIYNSLSARLRFLSSVCGLKHLSGAKAASAFVLPLVLGIFLVLSGSKAFAQVNTYTASSTSGTYTAITGGTVLATQTTPSGTSAAALDDVNYTVALPFDFMLNGTVYTSGTNIYANTNGFVAFGASAPTAGTYGPIGSTNVYNAAISAFGADCNGGYGVVGNRTSGSSTFTVTGGGSTVPITIGATVSGTGIPTGTTVVSKTATTITLSANATSNGTGMTLQIAMAQIRFETLGAAPNRTLVIQYRNMRPYNVALNTLDYQIRLKETTNIIEIVYGTAFGSAAAATVQVGLRGASNADFINRTSATSWSTTTGGGVNTSTVTYSSTVLPASGQTFTFTPPAAPTISSVTPASGCPGTTITITGTGFTGAAAANVRVGGTAVASITSISATEIVAVTAGGTTGAVTVSRAGGIATGSTFTFDSPPTPGSPSTTALNPGGFTVNWSASAGATSYLFDLSTSNTFLTFVTGFNGLDVGNVTSYVVTGLATSTTYYWRVRSTTACASGNTAAQTVVTPCNSLTAPVTETFAATIPSCWTTPSPGWTFVTADATNGVAGPYNGTHFARVDVTNINNSSAAMPLTTVPITVGAGSKSLSYYYFLGASGHTGATQSPLEVQISTNYGVSWTSLFIHNSGNSTLATTGATSNWTQKTIDLSAYSSQIVQFRFIAKSNWGFGTCNIGLDLVEVKDNCSGTPTAGTGETISPTDLACNGSVVTVALGSGFSTNAAIGIGYQWQSSADGISWANIAGATSTTYTTPSAVTAATYYRAVVSCSLSGLSANSTDLFVGAPFGIPTVSAFPPQYCGAGGTSVLTGAITGNNPYDTFVWSSPQTGVLSNETNTTADFTITESAAYTYTVTDTTSGCTKTASQSLNVLGGVNPNMVATPAVVCNGGTSVLSSGLSAGNFSYELITPTPSITNVGTQTLVLNGTETTPLTSGSLDDGGWANVPLGFTFNFFGTNYTTCNVGTNGTVMFGTYNGAALADYDFATLPSGTEPNPMIAVLAMDNNLTGATGGAIYTRVLGFPGNRIFQLTYFNVKEYGDTKFSTAQLKIYEATGNIEVLVTSSTNQDENKLVGVNGPGGAIGALAFSSGIVAAANNPIVTAFAYRFIPPQNYTTTWTPSADISGSASGTNLFSRTTNALTTLGTNTFNLQLQNQQTGCISNASVSALVVNPPATPVNADITGYAASLGAGSASNSPITVCGEQTATLNFVGSLTAADTVIWWNAATGGSRLGTGTSYTTAALTAGTSVWASINNGACAQSGRYQFVINHNSAPSVTVGLLGPDAEVNCSADTSTFSMTYQLSSSGAYAYTWTNDGAASSASQSGANYSISSDTLTTSSWSAFETGTGCVISGQKVFGVYSFPVIVPTVADSLVCIGGSTTLNSNVTTSAFGVKCVPFGFRTAPVSANVLCNAGSQVTPHTPFNGLGFFAPLDDAGWADVPLGFTFKYFGEEFTTVNVGTNGVINFGPYANFDASQYSFPGGFPDTLSPVNTIGVIATDLYLVSSGSIRYWTEGVSPARVFVIEYDAPGWIADGRHVAQAHLFEGTGLVEIHIERATGATGAEAKTIGLQDGTGTIGSTAPTNCDASGNPINITNTWNARIGTIQPSSPRAWRFIPPVSYSFSWSPSADISGPATGASAIALPTATVPGIQTYEVTVTDNTSGCAGAPIEVEIELTLPVAQPDVIGWGVVSDLDGENIVTFCGEQDLNLYVQAGAGYDSTYNAVWYAEAVGGTGYSIAYYDTITYGVSNSPLGVDSDDTLYVAIDNGICESPRRMVVLDFQEPDSLVITNSSPVNCGPSSLTYTSNITVSSAGAYTYSWTAPAGVLDTNTGSAVVATINNTVNVVVNAADALGFCVVEEVIPVSRFGFPEITPTAANDSICPGGGIQTVLNSNVVAGAFQIVGTPGTGYSPSVYTASTTLVQDGVKPPLPAGVTNPSTSLDDGFWVVPIGFTFKFLGNDYTQVAVSTNGNIQFGPTVSNSFTPSFGALAPNNFVALFWTDLDFNSSNGANSIRYGVSGIAPNRVFSVTFNGCRFGSSGTLRCRGQIDLNETTGIIKLNIQDVDAADVTTVGGGDATVAGAENLDGSVGSSIPARTSSVSGGVVTNNWSVTTPEGWTLLPPAQYTFNWVDLTSNPTSSIVGTNTQSTVTVAPTATSQYQLIATDLNTGCINDLVNQSYVTVTIASAPPVVNFVANDLTVTTGGVQQTVTFTTSTPALGNDTYAWSFSPNNVVYVGGTSATSRNPQVQFTEVGTYSATLTMGTCTGTSTFTRPNYVIATAEYCFPYFGDGTGDPDYGCGDGDAVDDVTIVNPNTSATVMAHLNTGCTNNTAVGGSYTDFSASPVNGVTTATLFQGTTYNMNVSSISPTFNEFFGAWIDVDNDGDFNDPLEFLGGNVVAAPSQTFEIGIPTSNVIYGLHKMRIMAAFGTGGPLTANDACLTNLWGEAHDYVVNIQPPPVLNDIPAFASNLQSGVVNFYPTVTTFIGNTSLASNSPETASNVIGGPDVWVRFTALSTAASITMSSTVMDDIIALYSRDAAGNYNLVASENAMPGAGDFERLNVAGLTPGTQYWVAFGSNTGAGAFTYSVQHLMRSWCAYTIPAGGFSLCNTFKAVYRGAPSQGVTYKFNFTPTGSTGGSATSLAGTNGLINLSNATLALRHGGTYNASVDVTYVLQNSALANEPINVLGSIADGFCTGVAISAHPLMEVRSNQRCPASLLRGNYLVGVTAPGSVTSFACGAINYTYEFTRVSSCGDTIPQELPFTRTTPSSTPYLSLGFFQNQANLGYWRVRIRPNFNGYVGTYGAPFTITVNNTSASTMLDEEVAEMDVKVESFIAANLYPNPNNGDMVNLNVSGIESDNVFVRITDAMGRVVYTNRFSVEGSLNTIVTFSEPLASGIYNVEFTVDGQIMTERMIVAKQ